MAEQSKPGPSLEPPSLFGRKRKSPAPAAAVPPGGHGGDADESPTTILDDISPPVLAEQAPAPTATSPLTPPPAPVEPRKAPKPPRQFSVDGRIAAVLAGLLVGLGIVGATAGSFNICEAARGTNSCGGPGIFLLLAILIAAIVVGAGILRVCRVSESMSTSFLAVGLVSVIALLFLVDALFSPWMFLVIPLVSAAAYVGSHWITTTFVEPGPTVGLLEEPEVVDHDVR